MSLTTLKRTLTLVLQDPQIQQRNALLTDATLRAELVSQLDALTEASPKRLLAADALQTGSLAPTGRLVVDSARRSVVLDTKGFGFGLSRFRDGVVQTPSILRRRTPAVTPAATPADRIRYVMADPGAGALGGGVFLLDENMEVVRVFPGYRAASNGYVAPTGAAVALLGAVETIAIACESDHRVRVYNFATGAHIVTIGTGIAGLPSVIVPLLTNPRSVTFDAANNRLFIACRDGSAGDASPGDVGFVAEFNITTIATPVFVGYVAVGGGDQQLAYGKCFAPSDVLFVDNSLYVSNGLGDVGRFARESISDPWLCNLSLEAVGADYVLGLGSVDPVEPSQHAMNALDVVTIGGSTKLLVGVSHLGSVEVFSLSSADGWVGGHSGSYGHAVHEVSMPFGVDLSAQSPVRRPSLTLGGLNRPYGVVGDSLTLPGDDAASTLVLVSDSGSGVGSGRLARLNIGTYQDANIVTWDAIRGASDLSLDGWWLLDGDLPMESCVLEYRDPGDSTLNPVVPGEWQQVRRDCVSQIVAARFQFRLRVVLSAAQAVKPYSTTGIGLLMTQV